MKKRYIFCIIFIILIMIILLILGFKNSNSKLIAVFNKKVEVPNNVYIKEEMLNSANTTIITNTYKKDNIIYQHIENDDFTENQDILWDFNTNQEIIIDNFSKTIEIIDITDNTVSPLNNIFISFNELSNEELKEYNYDYDEEVEVSGNICNKISLTKESGERTYFYLDVDSGLLYQKEEGQYYNNSFELYYKYNYTYSFDVVKDEDILVFNAENYPDYNFQDFTN